MTSSRGWKERQAIRISLGLDPENQPPYNDEPICTRCGVVLMGRESHSAGLCWVCRHFPEEKVA